MIYKTKDIYLTYQIDNINKTIDLEFNNKKEKYYYSKDNELIDYEFSNKVRTYPYKCITPFNWLNDFNSFKHILENNIDIKAIRNSK